MAVESRPCQRCQQPIPAERLEALPDTRLCVKCSETVGGDYILRVSSERTSKPGSLKLNYGGVKITKIRRRIKTLEEEEREAGE